MDADPDDEALSWNAPADPSHVESPGDGPAGPPEHREPIGSALLISYGVFAGIYLLYTVAWMISGMRNHGAVGNPLGDIVYRAGVVLAIAAVPLWFAVTLLLTRLKRPVLRLLWLFVGMIVLIPWPFILGV